MTNICMKSWMGRTHCESAYRISDAVHDVDLYKALTLLHRIHLFSARRALEAVLCRSRLSIYSGFRNIQ